MLVLCVGSYFDKNSGERNCKHLQMITVCRYGSPSLGHIL